MAEAIASEAGATVPNRLGLATTDRRLLIPAQSGNATETGDETGAQFYILPFGIKPAVLGITVFAVAAGVAGAFINEAMRPAVEKSLANSTVSLWTGYPKTTTLCAEAYQFCKMACYKEEMACYDRGDKHCTELAEVCIGYQVDGTKAKEPYIVDGSKATEYTNWPDDSGKPSCEVLQQECLVKSACFQGHQFCQVKTCFDGFMDADYTLFDRASRLVWSEKAKAYDECMHKAKPTCPFGTTNDVIGTNKGDAHLKCETDFTVEGKKYSECITTDGRPRPWCYTKQADDEWGYCDCEEKGCNHGLEECLVATKYEESSGDFTFPSKSAPAPITEFDPSTAGADYYLEDSCESQKAKCQTKCHEAKAAGIQKINLVTEHIELGSSQCESQCSKIGEICKASDGCLAKYQTCDYVKCASKKGGGAQFTAVTTTKANAPAWEFKDVDDKTYLECKDDCTRDLEQCFQDIEWACSELDDDDLCKLPLGSSSK